MAVAVSRFQLQPTSGYSWSWFSPFPEMASCPCQLANCDCSCVTSWNLLSTQFPTVALMMATTMGDTMSTLVPSQSTPIKHGTLTLLKFTTNYQLKEMVDMGDKMKDYIVGPMPAAEFLNEFLPLDSIQTASRAQLFHWRCFESVISYKTEPLAYDPFVGFFKSIILLQLTIWQLFYRWQPSNDLCIY